MMNDRPIEDANLQAGLDEVYMVLQRRGLAGTCVLLTKKEAAYCYHMHAPWSAILQDNTTPLGFRIRANSQRDGAQVAREKIEGAVHTICQISDFGARTMDWMEQLKAFVRAAGIDFDHNPHGGEPIPKLSSR